MKTRVVRVIPKPIVIQSVLILAFRTVIHRRTDSMKHSTVRLRIEPHGNLFLFVDGFDETHVVWYHNIDGGLVRWTFLEELRLHSSDPPSFHNQQHDTSNESKCSGDRWDEVAVGGPDMHAEELDRLSRGREADARVSEHHDAEGDQNDRNDGFCVHIESPVKFPGQSLFN